jgi:cysteine-rich repeat protein
MNPRAPQVGPRGALLALLAPLAAGALVVALVAACSSTPATPPAKDECRPGDAYYCRCANREEGSRVCNDDGKTYGPCEPCFGDPIEPPIDDDASFPPDPPLDAGRDARADASDGAVGCSNGTVEAGEECDDGNRTPNDGCSTTCKLEGAPASSDKCPGMPVHVWTDPVVYTASTVAFVNDYTTQPSCGGTTGSLTPERVFAVTAHKTGMLRTVGSSATFDHMLYLSETCAPTGNVLANQVCANTVSGNGGETLTFPVTSGTTYYVVLEGGAVNASGTVKLTWSIQ